MNTEPSAGENAGENAGGSESGEVAAGQPVTGGEEEMNQMGNPGGDSKEGCVQHHQQHLSPLTLGIWLIFLTLLAIYRLTLCTSETQKIINIDEGQLL